MYSIIYGFQYRSHILLICNLLIYGDAHIDTLTNQIKSKQFNALSGLM